MRSLSLAVALSLVLIPGIYAASQEKITVAPGLTLQQPQSWTVKRDTRTTFLFEHFKEGKVLDASIAVQMEKRAGHAEAVRRLAQIEAESPTGSEYSLIAGWPALVRRSVEPFQYPGEQEKEEGPWKHPSDEKSLQVTIAVAIGDYVVKLRELLQPGANPSLADEPLNIAKTLQRSRGEPRPIGLRSERPAEWYVPAEGAPAAILRPGRVRTACRERIE